VLTGANKGRLAGQQGVAAASAVKTALTVAALGTTAYARVLGKKLERAGDVPVEGGTTPNPATPEEVTRAQRHLTMLQWVIRRCCVLATDGMPKLLGQPGIRSLDRVRGTRPPAADSQAPRPPARSILAERSGRTRDRP
jgi:hypothetical protein